MSISGYYRFPSVHSGTLVFACEDDLWTVPVEGGVARRLTAGLAECMWPLLSPDGSLLAFAGREEGNPEVYVMPANGGSARRLTYFGAGSCSVVGWKDNEIFFATNYGQPFLKLHSLYAVGAAGGAPRALGIGSAMSISYGPGGRVALGRNSLDIARWKRYRGGTAGNIWIDLDGSNRFVPFLPQHNGEEIRGNLANPIWLGERLYFVSDHEGVGNLYSAGPDGTGLGRHTDHADYYVRHPSTDGARIVYCAGGDLFVFEPEDNSYRRIDIALHSPQTQRNRKYVDPAQYLDDYAVHPDGYAVTLTARGRSFTMPNWEQAVLPVGEGDQLGGAGRYRLTQWLSDGCHLVTVSDASGEEVLEVHREGGGEPVKRFDHIDVGRVLSIAVSPDHNHVVLANHRQEVLFVDLDAGTSRCLDRSHHFEIRGLAFSPDGRYVAYGFQTSLTTSIIKVADVESGETFEVTRPVLRDVMPTFDPDGKYLYFLSYRVFNPVYDNLDLDMNVPKGVKPYCIALRKDVPSPFVALPKTEEEVRQERLKALLGDGDEESTEPGRLEIDFEGIQDRIVAFPVPEGRYEQLQAASGMVFFTRQSVVPSLGLFEDPPPRTSLQCFRLDTLEETTIADSVVNFRISAGGGTLVYRSGNQLRVVPASCDKPSEKLSKSTEPSRKSGWLDLSRVKLLVEPADEWKQMYREAWRMQREHFWSEDMAGIDWQAVYDRYLPLLDRVATRSEFSDLIWEMQGELGTSHCYEFGGDYRQGPRYTQGSLGAEFEYDSSQEAYRITRIIRGDPWEEGQDSPLRTLGVNAKEGDLLLAVAGVRLSSEVSPALALVNQAKQYISLELADADGANRRKVVVRALETDCPLRYREWVDNNRKKVHDATEGRVGYIHIPNMMGRGMSEFFRGYLAEANRDMLIVDVRFNGGGHTSQLILEKLRRRRLGYAISRWGAPEPYPTGSMLGPIVAITNEFAGSDGDIFSHAFKMMKLGTLIGKRTWGGVVGVTFRTPLVDGAQTTQPEFSFWFHDVGWGVENHGADPHIEVDIAPQDTLAGRDPQLDAAINEIKRQMAAEAPTIPDFPGRPCLALPELPERS